MLPETSNMLMTAVLDTSASKHGWVVSTETVGRCAVAGSRASQDQPQIQIFRTSLLKVDVLTGLLLDAFLSLTAEATLSSLPSSWQDPPCVLRTVLSGAVQDSPRVCLILSGQDPALVPG